RRARGGHAGRGVSGSEGPRGADRVRRSATLGEAGRRSRAAAAPARHAAGRLGRLHLRDGRRGPDPATHPAPAGAGRGAQPATRPALRAGRHRPRRPSIRPRGHRCVAGGSGTRRRPPGPGGRRRRSPLDARAPRAARRAPAHGTDDRRLGRRRAARRRAGLAYPAGSAPRAGRMIRLAIATLVVLVVGIPLAILPAAPISWLAVAAAATGGVGVLALSVSLVTASATLSLIGYALAL